MTTRTGLNVAVILLLTGCGSVEPRAGFDKVQGSVRERIDQRIHWRGETEEDEAVDAAVREMLADELTLEEAVQVALLNNPHLQAAYEDLSVSQSAVVQSGLLRNPVFDASIHFVESGGRPELGFSITQEFLDIFFIPMRKKIVESEFEAAKLRITAAVMDVAVQTRAVFYHIVADEQLVEMRKQVVLATGASYDLARRLHEAGNIRNLDLANERALHEQAKLDLAGAQLAVEEHRERLNTLLGLWGMDTRWQATHRLPEIPAEPLELEGMEHRAVANSLDLAIARQEIESFGRRLGLTRATAGVPFVDLGVSTEREEGGWKTGPTLSLPIPLFDQGQARVAGVAAELRRREQALIAQAVEVRAVVRATRQRMLTAQRIAEHYRDTILPLSDEVLQQTQLEYNAMQVGAFELLTAKQRQIATGQHYIEALRNYWLARSDLDQILHGRLSNLSATVEPVAITPFILGAPENSEQGGH